MTVPPRVELAVQLLDPAPTDRVLEFGCGPGVAAALVCDRLTTGRLIALDRSATAVARTTARNSAHIAAGRLAVHRAALHEIGDHVDPSSLDTAFGIDVNLFWTGPSARELAALAAVLRPGGRLLVCFGVGPSGSSRRVTPTIAEALAAHGFVDVVEHVDAAGSAVSGRRA